MSRLLRAGAGLVAVVAIGTFAVGWLEDVPSLSASQAVEATGDAFRGAGLDGEVDTEAVARTYQSPGRSRVDVWETNTALDGANVQIFLARSDGDPIWIDDRSPNGTERVLSDDQFRALVAHADNPAATERVRRNRALAAAAAALVAVALSLALLPARHLRRYP